MARIGIFSSSFDPITYSHLWTAQTVAHRRKLDKVIFVPSSESKADENRSLSDGEHRWNMINLAIKDNPKFEADKVELKASSWSRYTCYTMDYFHNKYPDDDIYVIMSADNLEDITSWRASEDLIKNNQFIVVGRDNYNMLDIISKDKLLRKYEMEHFDLLHKGSSMNISSSYIREEISVGGSPKYLLPNECYNYIKENKLYLE